MKKLLSLFLVSLFITGTLFTAGCSEEIQNNSSDMPESSEVSEEKEAIKLRVASYNIAHVGQYSFTDENYQELADVILSQSLDIVGIQEAVCGVFSADSPNERYTDSLGKLKELTGYEYVYYLNWDDESNTAWGILSKYPVTNLNTGTIIESPIESLTTNSDHYYNENEKNTVQNYSVSSEEGGNLIEIDVKGEKISFWVTHSKPASFAASFGHIKGDERKFIMVGDFNNPAYTDLTDFQLSNGTLLGSNMSLVNNENNKLITFPRDQKFMDNILYTTEDFTLVSSGVVENDSSVSDHYLIWAEFEIK